MLLLYVTTMTDLRDKVDWTETDIHMQQTRFLAHLALYYLFLRQMALLEKKYTCLAP
jgi:hypothetical protein